MQYDIKYMYYFTDIQAVYLEGQGITVSDIIYYNWVYHYVIDHVTMWCWYPTRQNIGKKWTLSSMLYKHE